MILNSDFKIRYEQLNELYRRAQSLSDKVIFSMDISQSPQSKIREAKDFLREPDYPVHITSSQDDEIRRVYPKYTI
jgi:hypothetical protein